MPVDNVSPGLAALLGFIPGVGAVYNGQAGKGFLHLIAFVTLIAISNEVGPITVPVWFFFVGYMVVDAHKTAKARKYGQPLPDWFGLNNVFGHSTPSPVAPPAATYAQPNPNVYQAGVAPEGQPVYYEQPPELSAWIEPAGRGDHPDRARVPVSAAKRWDVPVPLDRQTVATDPDSCGSEHVPAP